MSFEITDRYEHQQQQPGMLLNDNINDVHNEGGEELEAAIRRAQHRKGLDEAIELLSDVEKSAFLEACRLAPHLVETESDPFCFLRYEQYNYWKAANRIVEYWGFRQKVFGRDKYLLPLTLNNTNMTVGGGDGNKSSALDPQTIYEIRNGVALYLPNDSSGRSVFYVHHTRFGELPVNVRLQLLFYCNFILMRSNPRSQKDGVVFLWHKPTTQVNDQAKAVVHAMRISMPVRTHSIHILSTSSQSPGADPVMLDLWKIVTNDNAHVHLGCCTPEGCAQKLAPFGFTKDRLPNFLGGSWKIVQWDGIGQELGEDVDFHNEPYCPFTAGFGNDDGKVIRRHAVGTVIKTNDETIKTAVAARDHQSLPSNQPRRISNDVSNDDCAYIQNACIANNSNEDDDDSNNNRERKKKKRRKRDHFDSDQVKPSCANAPCQPTEVDVLFGQGRSSFHHNGNISFRRTVDQYSEAYDQASTTKAKIHIRKIVFESVATRQAPDGGRGRFLKFHQRNKQWFEVLDDVADMKIAQTLRNKRKD